MPKWLKIILGLIVACTLLCGVGVGGVVWWFDRNRAELKGKGDAALADGRAFGAGKPAQECVAEALDRSRKDDGILAGAMHKLFLRACLETSEVPPDFCAGIPPRGEIIKTATWSLDYCAAQGLAGDQPCTRLVQSLQEHCEKPSKDRAP